MPTVLPSSFPLQFMVIVSRAIRYNAGIPDFSVGFGGRQELSCVCSLCIQTGHHACVRLGLNSRVCCKEVSIASRGVLVSCTIEYGRHEPRLQRWTEPLACGLRMLRLRKRETWHDKVSLGDHQQTEYATLWRTSSLKRTRPWTRRSLLR